MNLLVIDFDYFFRNPILNENQPDDWELYDWKTTETTTGDIAEPNWIWNHRAAMFLTNQIPLPYCTGYDTFWDRFTIPTTTPIYVADSNRPAGNLITPNGHPWNQVDLYDAHHDAGYHELETYDLDCGNWMLHHHLDGTKNLNVHYPPWRDTINGTEPPPIAPVNRRIDTGDPNTTHYDTVFVCRSGAWVPSWCDHQFQDFIDAAPNPITWYEKPVTQREFDINNAKDITKAIQMSLQKHSLDQAKRSQINTDGQTGTNPHLTKGETA